MDFSKLSTGAKLALIGGAVLVINIFLPWYQVSAFGFSASANAFDAGFLAWFGSLVGIAGAAVLLLKAMGTKIIEAGQFKSEQLALLLGAAAFVLILLRWLTQTEFVAFGLFLGLAAAAAITYGAFMAMKDAGLDMPKLPGTGS